MAEASNNEVEDLKFETSESLKEENTQEEEIAINSDTIQQDRIQELEESSLDDPAKVNKVINSETKPKLSYNSGEKGPEINSGITETDSSQAHSFAKTDESTMSVTVKPSKEDLSVRNKMKNNISKISADPKIVSVTDSNTINYSMPGHSTVRIKCSSSSTENQVKTHSSEDDEQYIIEKYKVFPKNVPSAVNVNPNLITVKFECGNINFVSAFDMKTTVEEIKRRLCYILELEEDSIGFHNNNVKTKDSQTLADLGAEPYGKVVFNVFSENGHGGNKLLIAKIEENIPTLDVITVHINEGEYYRDLVVEIANESVQKQWLGGYRNKLTGTEYHNADTQTLKPKKVFEIDKVSGEKIPLFFNRDTQTPFPLIQKTVDTVVDKATQMSRSDLYINSKKDKIMSSHNHEKRELLLYTDKCYVKYVIMIQRAVRKWIMRKKFVVLIKTQIEQLKKFKRDQQKIVHDQEVKDRAVITGAAYPVNRDDFYALFLRVEKWWKKEWKKICETKRSEPKKALSIMLVEEETKLLEAIEKHKAASKAESLKKEEMRFLEQISRPVLFRTSKGRLATIDYLETQKAREFKEIYSALTRKDVLPKDRIEMLIAMKKLFELHYEAYEYAKDLVSLINREIELIGIGLKLSDLRGLQRRIEQLFLNFLQQPQFNPSAKKFKKPNLPKTLHETFQCSRCLKLLPASKYPVHVRMRAFTQCKSCTWMENIAHKRVDMSPYLKLLHQVQNSEMQKCCHSAICFILQPIGMGHLTNVIWHGHSAISECSDISKLHHVRWLPDVEWAPWNTILLTDQEAKLHESIPDIFTFYDKKLIERVRQKHILARKRFIPLLMMDHDIRSSGQWSKITDSGVFLHPSHAERMANENPEYDAI